jgi:hypothetical protein
MLLARVPGRVPSLLVKYLGVVVLLAGCFASSTPPPQHARSIVPPPQVLRPLPLKPGQWARYEERDAHGVIGEARFDAVATTFCGTWVRAALGDRRGARRTWLLCVRGTGGTPREHITRALVDDGDVREIDPARECGRELDALATRIVAPDLLRAYERDEVTVPAGTFEDALRTQDSAGATWLHPLVPFSGAVKITGRDGREDVLVEFGDTAVDVPKRFVTAERALHRHRPFVAGGLGFSRNPDQLDVTGNGTSKLGALGLHITRALDVVAVASSEEQVFTAGGGVRWSALRWAPSIGLTFDFYVQGVAGYAESGTSRGVGATASAGWLTGRGGDWGLAVQADLLGARFEQESVAVATIGLLLQLELR